MANRDAGTLVPIMALSWAGGGVGGAGLLACRWFVMPGLESDLAGG